MNKIYPSPSNFKFFFYKLQDKHLNKKYLFQHETKHTKLQASELSINLILSYAAALEVVKVGDFLKFDFIKN